MTVNTQPAMLAASVAFYEAWRAAGGPAPEVCAGHSLGEYSALTAAGALDFEEAVKLVRFRAQAMQDAVAPGVGGMAAVIGLADEDVLAACEAARATGVVEAVNFNAPGQVVIAGEKAALAAALEACKVKGCRRAIELPVSAPFHSSLLKGAAEALRARLAEVNVKTPLVPVIHNVDVAQHAQPDAIREALASQAAGAVQWVATVRRLKDMGVTDVVECGPGKVLTGLIKRIDADLRLHNVYDAASLNATLAALKE